MDIIDDIKIHEETARPVLEQLSFEELLGIHKTLKDWYKNANPQPGNVIVKIGAIALDNTRRISLSTFYKDERIHILTAILHKPDEMPDEILDQWNDLKRIKEARKS